MAKVKKFEEIQSWKKARSGFMKYLKESDLRGSKLR